MIYKYRIPPSLTEGTRCYADDDGNIVNENGTKRPPYFYPYDHLHRGGSKYPYTRFNNKPKEIHRLICAARWGLPRKGQECHHLNGDKFDNRPSNLIWLSKSRHRLYDARLKSLKTLFTNVSIFSRRDFIRFANMSEASFQSMLAKYHRDPSFDQMEYDMTHHMEF